MWIFSPFRDSDNKNHHQVLSAVFQSAKYTMMHWKFASSSKRLPPSKFICWRPNLQYSRIWRWGLWGVIRFRWGHESAAPSDGIRALKWRGWDHETRACSSSSSHVSAQWEGGCKPGRWLSPGAESVGPLILGFQSPELWDIKFYVYTVHGILL